MQTESIYFKIDKLSVLFTYQTKLKGVILEYRREYSHINNAKFYVD